VVEGARFEGLDARSIRLREHRCSAGARPRATATSALPERRRPQEVGMLRRRSGRSRCPRERARPPRTRSVRQHRDRIAFAKSTTPLLRRPLVNLERPGDTVGRNSVRHHQQCAPAQVDPLLDLRSTEDRLDVLTLLPREHDGHRRATARSARRPRCCLAHASSMPASSADGKLAKPGPLRLGGQSGRQTTWNHRSPGPISGGLN
jgi:hypothetical protein